MALPDALAALVPGPNPTAKIGTAIFITPSSGFWDIEIQRATTEFGSYGTISTQPATDFLGGGTFTNAASLGSKRPRSSNSSGSGQTSASMVSSLSARNDDPVTISTCGKISDPFALGCKPTTYAVNHGNISIGTLFGVINQISIMSEFETAMQPLVQSSLP